MSNFVYLCRAYDSGDRDLIFRVPEAAPIPASGDLIGNDSEVFVVSESFLIALDSPEYRAIDAICIIHPASAIYSRRWSSAADA